MLFVFAAAMGVATFVENDFGTQTARTVIYNAWWFELVMILLGLNFVANIFRYKLYKKRKWSVLLFHVGFIVILLGAGITRYTGFEGIMRIREGESSNTMISDKNYVQVRAIKNGDSINLQKEMYFSPIKENNLELKTEIKGQEISIRLKQFISDAEEKLIASESDTLGYLELVLAAENGRESIFLKEGTQKFIGEHAHSIGFMGNIENDINFLSKEDSLFIRSGTEGSFFVMASQEGGKIEVGRTYPFRLNTLYRFYNFSFVAVKHMEKGHLEWVSTASKPKDNNDLIDDLVLLEVETQGRREELPLIYRHGYLPQSKPLNIEGLELEIAYGALAVQTDFDLKLRDFQLERYPGSTSPSSYASEVTIIDNDGEKDHRIYMNHVLDYKGHRFFQASYDTDEMGTVLAVNRDFPGTFVTYIGYILMGLGMLLTLFNKGSRFSTVRKKLNKLKTAPISLLLMFTFSSNLLLADQGVKDQNIDSILKDQTILASHASLFGKLMVQDLDGRIKPMNTLASEFLRKMTRKNYYAGTTVRLDADQVFLAIHLNPRSWFAMPLIKVDHKKLGGLMDQLDPDQNGLIPFTQLLGSNENYILETYVKEANEKKPAERNEFDKEIILVDERFNLLYNVLSGNYLKIFPKKNDPSKTWYNPNHDFEDFETEDKRFIQGIIPLYFGHVQQAKGSGDYIQAEDKLAYIKKYQDVLAADIIPSKERIQAELWYNQLNLNFWLFQAYFMMGILLLIVALLKIFHRNRIINIVINILIILILISFLLHSFNLILRWYIAGHPPWSNGYEMIVFVAWGLMLFGLMFFRSSDFSLPLASIFAGTLLFVSYLDWLSPEITNLMPVLKSYWLKIHVATIISSYAPLALSALLGILAQILIIFRNQSNDKVFERKIKELSYINEMSMTLGLFILSIGTFLGGVWANESWGRYWAWDPKETWALISIIIYAIVLHIRLIPKLNNIFSINMASTFAFFSIVMTSFGVNYYLTGLHSYATGDPVPIPKFVYVCTAVLCIISVVSFIRFKNFQGSLKNN